MENKKLTPASLGEYKVFSRRTKHGFITYDIKRLIGFVYTGRGEIIRPRWQRVFTLKKIYDAILVCHAFNAKISRYCNAIAVTKCHGITKVIYLSNLVDPLTPSRIRHENITRFFGFTPIDDINDTRNAVRFFVDFDLYLDYINGK